MRFLILDDDEDHATDLCRELEVLQHTVSVVPNVDVARVALQVQDFDIALLSEHILIHAGFSLIDYLKITQPRVCLVRIVDLPADSDFTNLQTDWTLARPVSPLELLQVAEYLRNEASPIQQRLRRGTSPRYKSSQAMLRVSPSGKPSRIN
jgi:DNA-binding response OmpR family regulator